MKQSFLVLFKRIEKIESLHGTDKHEPYGGLRKRCAWKREPQSSTRENGIWGPTNLKLSCHSHRPLPLIYQNTVANKSVCEWEAEEMYWVI